MKLGFTCPVDPWLMESDQCALLKMSLQRNNIIYPE